MLDSFAGILCSNFLQAAPISSIYSCIVLWDLIKHKIRQRTITYSKGKARERREKIQKVKEKLEECTDKCDIDPNSGNLEKLECLHTEYD